jgi:hypothetical protein
MSDVLPVTRITQQSIQAIRMELGPGGQTAGVIAALLAMLMNPALGLGYTTESATNLEQYEGGWRIKIMRGDDPELVAFTGDWIVVTDAVYSDANGWQLQKTSRVHIYGVSAGMAGTAVDFVNAFSTNTNNTNLIWDATTNSPVATAISGLSAILTFKQPFSANGPFQYRVASGPGVAGTFSDPDENGIVSVTITGLTAGPTTGGWTVQAKAAQYTGITATSLPSNDIVAADVVVPPPPADPGPVHGPTMMGVARRRGHAVTS